MKNRAGQTKRYQIAPADREHVGRVTFANLVDRQDLLFSLGRFVAGQFALH